VSGMMTNGVDKASTGIVSSFGCMSRVKV